MKKTARTNRLLLNLFVLTTKKSIFLAALLGTWALACPLAHLEAQGPFLSIIDHYAYVERFWAARLKADPFSRIAPIKFAEAKISLARSTGDESHFRAAEEQLKQSIARQVRYAPALETKLAVVLMSRHKFKKALTIANKAYRETSSLDALIARGDAYLGLGNYKEARKDFEKAVEMQAGFSTWVRLGHVLEVYGENEKALALFLKARDDYQGKGLEPAAWIRLRIGIYYLKKNQLTQADEWFKKSLKVAPDYYLAQEHLAEVHELRGEYLEAKPLLESAIKSKRDPLLLLRLANVQKELGNNETATTLDAEAMALLEKNATGSTAHNRDLAQELLDRKKDITRARELAYEDWLTRPGDITANLVLAKAYRLEGKPKQAWTYLEKAQRFGKSPEIAEEEALLKSGS